MTQHESHPVAVVGMSAIMPDAPSGDAFWHNITAGKYSISPTPADRWDPALYYDEDHSVPDKTYSAIGGWVREFDWNPVAWRLPVPPVVAAQMDVGQQWAVSAARAALTDAGWPKWPVDNDRVAVILGNALGGEKHYQSCLRIRFPEMLRRLEQSSTLATLAPGTREHIIEETRRGYLDNIFSITEDTMPGELANVIAGRVSNLLNLRGMNYTTDAACASGLAAMNSAVSGLVDHQFDAVVTGGIDRNMGVEAFVKFCKIGALSATGTRPFDAGADGFVMGEGAALFVLKRLEDAERDGDRIYGVILGIGGSSDGKGKGITAPNPVGQKLSVERAWDRAGVDPSTAGAIEAHGTSTSVGDASELTSLAAVFGPSGAAPGSIALGSVKSNIGHLKAAAGAAGLFKMLKSLHEKQLAPSLSFTNPNPNVDWDTLPFAVNTELRPWPKPANDVRRGGVSAFGFGGTNFHVVLEEHVPGRHRPPAKSFASAGIPGATPAPAVTLPTSQAATTPAATGAGASASVAVAKAPLRGALVLGGRDDADLASQVNAALAQASAGVTPPRTAPDPALASAAVRVAVDYKDAADLATKLTKLTKAFASGNPAAFRLLRQQGIFLGRGPAPKIAFLYTGQGSQYVNMLKSLAAEEPIVKATFDEADRVMTPLLGRPLTSYIFVDGDDPAAVKTLNKQLMQTEITQPAVLSIDIALTRLLAAYGVQPDMVMGHSLGEYGALVAAGSLTLDSALEAVSARGREMTKVSLGDNGAMAAVFAPMADIERIVDQADGYVVIANINSKHQGVIGGVTDAVERVIARFAAEGFTATRIPVSHAFHTSIVADASVPFVNALRRLDLRAPTMPVVANVTGDFYPEGCTTETVLEYAGKQIASPVQFVKGLRTLYAAGVRVFVEVGPKKALHGFVEDVLGSEHDDVVSFFTNHPKLGDDVAFNQALCGLYAAGIGLDRHEAPEVPVGSTTVTATSTSAAATPATTATTTTQTVDALDAPTDATIHDLGLLFADVLEKGMHLYSGTGAAGRQSSAPPATAPAPAPALPKGPLAVEPVVVTGAALGLPGTEKVFDDDNVAKILAGQNFISVLGDDARQRMVDMRIVRLVKDAASGGGSFATIDKPQDVIKLAGVLAPLNVVEQFGVDKARDEALDTTTRLAIGAGFDAMRDAGIPLVMNYKTTTLGTQLPDRWGLPEALRDETGVIFASAFPGYNRFAEAAEGYALDRGRREGLLAVEAMRARLTEDDPATAEVDALIKELRETLELEPYQFDRRFLFQALSFGHAQFAEIIGARGPNTQVNSACASTTLALSLAEDWIRAGRCSRVVVVAADDATGPQFLPWITAGFLASGAAATDERVEDAALPFDLRRHGMIIGAGAASFVVESAEAARERGIQPIAEVLGSVIGNSAFHGSRLDVQHICDVMEAVVSEAEGRGIDRHEIAPRTMFVSHETFTPARGGSAAAEINALRRVFGPSASQIVIANTKGFTGHAMAAGFEDVVSLKVLETGIVPPVPNYQVPDPDLGTLNLSKGGQYPVEYALRLAAGFGSQVAMSLLRWTPVPDGQRRAPGELGYAYRIVDQAAWQHWLDRLSGHPGSRLEVDRRRLRVVDTGPATTPVERSGHVPVPYADRLAPTRGFAAPTSAAHAPATAPAGAGAQPQVLPTVPMVPIAPAVAHPAQPAPTPDARPAVLAAVPAPAATPAAPAVDAILDQVVGIVAEMTGYPADLLDPALDLEADLGVDTVKQAEVFAAVRTQWNLDRDETLQLREFPTLNHVAGWVRDKLGTSTAGGSVGTPGSADVEIAETVHAAPHTVLGDLDAVDALPRRVPTPSLRPSVEQCLPTGVALDGSRVVVMLDEGGVGQALIKRLRKAGATALELDPGTPTDEVLSHLVEWRAEGPIAGVYWLAALDNEGDLAGYDLTTWREALRRRVNALYATMRHLWEDAPFLVSATRLGGYHGYSAAGAASVLGGAVTGFTKSYKKERPDALVKAVDLPVDRKTAAVADLLIEETLRDPGCVEIGRIDGRRFGIALLEQPFPARGDDGASDATGGMPLTSDSVVLVTGAAGSIVSAITADLATASGGVFHLLDLTPAPDSSDPDILAFRSDRASLKGIIAARMKERGDKPTPVVIDREVSRIERLEAALTCVEAVEAAGGTAYYYPVDLTDADAVASAMDLVRERSGHLDVLLHAAGLEISRNLPEKEPREFDLVFGVKTTGWFNVWHAAQEMEVGAVVAFSSVAARFGNMGQTDYSSANDLLCKVVSSMRDSRPQTRGLALDWTAWGGIGMATRGSIPKIMEMAGVQMLPPEAGVAWIRRELTSHAYTGEVVVAGTLGMMAAEYHDGGGVDADAVAQQHPFGPMVDDIAVSVHEGVLSRVTLDPMEQAFLNDHRIDGTPVLPGVMGMEAFAEVAGLVAPVGYRVAGVEDVDFLAPVKFYRDKPRTLTVAAVTGPDPEGGDDLLAQCTLTAERLLPGSDAPVRTTHFTGRVRLTSASVDKERSKLDRAPHDPVVESEDVYRFYFHGPAYQVVESAWRDGEGSTARLVESLKDDRSPAETPLTLAPRLVELCFQAAGLWDAARKDLLALPLSVGRVRVLLDPATATGRLVAHAEMLDGHVDAVVVDEKGRVVVRLDAYRTVAMPGGIPDDVRVCLRAAFGSEDPS